MIINEHTRIKFYDRNIAIAKTIVDVRDKCFEYNIDTTDKQFAEDIDRLSQYCTLTTIIELINCNSDYVVFVDTGYRNNQLSEFAAYNSISKCYNVIAKAIKHRFIKCQNCMLPLQPTMVCDLLGELKDKVMLAAAKSPNNLARIKKFVRENRLIDLQNKFDDSVSLSKILLFL